MSKPRDTTQVEFSRLKRAAERIGCTVVTAAEMDAHRKANRDIEILQGYLDAQQLEIEELKTRLSLRRRWRQWLRRKLRQYATALKPQPPQPPVRSAVDKENERELDRVYNLRRTGQWEGTIYQCKGCSRLKVVYSSGGDPGTCKCRCITFRTVIA